MPVTRFAAVAIAVVAIGTGVACAQEPDEKPTREQQLAWKLTPTYESSTREAPAWDFNLRRNSDTQTWWVGYYQRQEEFRQLRLGYERPLEVSQVKLLPSLQYATRGYLGGSINAEVGERYFLTGGWSRTNLKENFSITFDPSDAVTFGAGTRVLPDTVLTVYQIRDDRLDTGQRVTHLVARIRPDSRTRWTLDVFHKRGRPDSDPASELLHATGAIITYDFDRYFVRVANDPYVNFSDSHMVRVAIGLRF